MELIQRKKVISSHGSVAKMKKGEVKLEFKVISR